MADKYCYPDTGTLKNKLNIKDKHELFQAEVELTSAELYDLQINPVKGNFDFKHLCDIHHRIFQDLYEWAGEPRTVNIGKENIFCLVQYIDGYASDIFKNYYKDCQAVKENPEQFVHTLTGYYADVNALHPFREGNGRTQREFTRELCLDCGYTFNLNHTTHKEMVAASIASFNGDNKALEEIFKTAIQPIADYEKHQQRLQQSLSILSMDDLPEKNDREYE